MLTEIENAITALYEEKVVLPARQIGAGKADGKGVKQLAIPRVMVGISSGAGRKIAQDVYEITPRIWVMLEFSNLRSEKDSRQGAYPILQGLISYLIGQTLNLDIRPLKFVQFSNSTSEEDSERGLSTFTTEFSTTYQIRKLPDAEAGDLITLGLDYLLGVIPDQVDMQGTVDLSEDP